MPPSLVNTFSIWEIASLFDYLEGLAKKQETW